MGDANVRRPVATRFEHGVDFGLLVHKSPFMADKRDPLVLSNYIFELLEVNPGVAGFLIQLHTEDVDAVVESVTAHAEKGAGTKTTLYVGQEEELFDPPPKNHPYNEGYVGKERGWGVFEGAESIFFRWFAPKLRVGGCSRNCVLTRGSAPRPRTLHPILRGRLGAAPEP